MKCLLVDSHWRKTELGPRLGLASIAGSVSDLLEVQALEFLVDLAAFARLQSDPPYFYELEEAFLNRVTETAAGDTDIAVLGLTGWSGSFSRMLRIARRCKTARPDLLTVFGGHHVTLHESHCPPAHSLLARHPEIDFLFVGEGETLFRRFMQTVRDARRNPSELAALPRRQTVAPAEYCTAPRADWRPFLQNTAASGRLVFAAESSRGCPHRCLFCDERAIWKRYRTFDPAWVVERIAESIELFNSHSCRFADPTVAGNSQILALCRALIDRRLDLAWSGYSRVDEVAEEKAAALAEAGCKVLFLGIESGNQSTLDYIRKDTQLGAMRQSVRLLQKHGILVRGGFIVGLPGEPVADALTTLAFAKDLGLDQYSWHTYQAPFRTFDDGGDGYPDFSNRELDLPGELMLQLVRERHEKLLELDDMLTIPRLVALDPHLGEDWSDLPEQLQETLGVLRRAIGETGTGFAYDLQVLSNCEKQRRARNSVQ